MELFPKIRSKFSEKRNGIVLCNRGQIIDQLNYSQITAYTHKIIHFLQSYGPKKSACIALWMSHNLFIPSLIISLKELELPFIFMDPKCKDNTATLQDLKISWILSFTNDIFGFKVNEKLELTNGKFLYLLEPSIRGDIPPNYEDIFYIIKTSGTTGANKYVYVQNNCILNNIESLNFQFKLGEDDLIYFGTSLTFDPSMVELLLALVSGACLLIVPESHRINPIFLYEALFLRQAPVTVLQVVPSLFLRWSQAQIEDIMRSKLRILAFGGEPFPEAVLKFERSPELRLFNLYGITEVSCWASISEIASGSEQEHEITLGRPLGDTIVQVRDDRGRPIDEGEGEIFIGSSGRICYVDSEISEVNEKSRTDRPLFRATGDLGKITNSEITYLARKGAVIKRFGHKINLNKLENEIYKITGLSNKCLWFKSKAKLLTFFIIHQLNTDHNEKILDHVRVKLLHSLPPSHFPDFLHSILTLPITSNGKLNTKALKLIYLNQITRLRGGDLEQDRIETFQVLLQKYFGLELDPLLDKTFVEIGGNSIMSIQFLNEFCDRFNLEVTGEFVNILLEKPLRLSLEFVRNNKFRKRSSSDERTIDGDGNKKIKTELSWSLEIDWSYNLKACIDTDPIIFTVGEQSFVAVGSFSRIFAVLNAKTGVEVAKFVLGDVIENPALFEPSTESIFVGCFDGNLYCLDYQQNCIKWTYSTKARIKNLPVLCRGSSAIGFGSYDQYFHCITLTGEGVWRTFLGESLTSNPHFNPATRQIFVAGIQGTCFSLSETDGSILWSYKVNSPIFGAPGVLQEALVWPDVQGTLHCLSLAGNKLWEINCASNLYGSLSTLGNHLIVPCYNGNLSVVDTDSKKLKTLVKLNESLTTAAIILSNSDKTKHFFIVSSNKGTIYLIDFLLDEVIGRIQLPGNCFSTPCTLGDNQVFIGCRDNKLYSIKLVNS